MYTKFLQDKRGWVTRWPEKAVMIYSGGMDSTITQARMLEEREIELFPVFIDRGQHNVKFEEKSADFFAGYFAEKYGDRYHGLVKIKINVPAAEIKNDLKKYAETHGYPLRNTILQMVGVQYGVSLLNSGHEVKSVLCAQVNDDPFPHSTLSSLRINTINVCDSMNEWDWQITSPNIDPYLEKELIGKIEMIKWAAQHGLPIEKTRSCYSAVEKACGECLTCRRRKLAFATAGVIDKTDYVKS